MLAAGFGERVTYPPNTYAAPVQHAVQNVAIERLRSRNQ